MIWKAFFAWSLIVPLAILNGLFREAVLSPLLGSDAALPASGCLLAALIMALTWFFLPYFGPIDARSYRYIGAGWLVLTIAFEFGFGLFAAGKTWTELLQAYDIRTGNLWSAVLMTIAISPWAVAKIRRRI